jgi:ComF family protein
MIIPVPMHPDRLQLRGYNHAELLAEYLGGFLGIPVWPSILKRHVDTAPQRMLSRSERERNLINVFVVKKRELVKNKRVLLVDDIYTTGFTAEGCSAALLEGGAQRVIVSIMAIGLDKSRNLSKIIE